MAFWGVEVKPGKPFTHSPHNGGRLHISQATLGLGTAPTKSVVQCNIGNKAPVLLCSLYPKTAECSQLHLEFQESDQVVFSVVGPLSVHLSGYYLPSAHRYDPDNDTDSYGEDIANSETERSVDSNNEDDYEDSFVNDSDPGIIPSSPVSSDGVPVVEENFDRRKPKNRKGGRKRLRKQYQLSDSDDDAVLQRQRFVNASNDLRVLDSESEDKQPISLLFKNGSDTKNIRSEAEGKGEMNKMELGDDANGVGVSKQKADAVVDGETERLMDNYNSVLHSAEVASGAKLKKKKEKVSKLGKPLEAGDVDDFFFGMVLKQHKLQPRGEDTNKVELPLLDEEEKNSNDSIDAVTRNVTKSKKRRKHSEEDKGLQAVKGQQDMAEGENQGNLIMKNQENQNQVNNELVEDKAAPDETKADNVVKDVLVPNEDNQKQANSSRNVEKLKKRKKKHSKVDIGLEAHSPANDNAIAASKAPQVTAEGENLLRTSQENHKNPNDEEHKTPQGEAKGDKVRQDMLVPNESNQKQESDKLISMTTCGNQKLANEGKCENHVSQSVDEKSEKKKRRKKTNRTQEKVEALNMELSLISG